MIGVEMANEYQDALNYMAARAFIEEAHAGQMYGDMPYWRHPVEVAEFGIKIFGPLFTQNCKIAALLHDVVEDTDNTLDDLRKLTFTNESIVATVALLTKNPDISYEENIDRIIESGNVDAMRVKFCDNSVNYNGDKTGWPERRRVKLNSRYRKSMGRLSDAILNWRLNF